MVAVVMVVVMPATPAPGRSSGWQRSETLAEALSMRAKDITGPRPVKHCVNGRRTRSGRETENLVAQGFKHRARKQLIAMETFGTTLESRPAQVSNLEW